MTVSLRERWIGNVTDSYLETALWSSVNYTGEEDDTGDEPFDENYCVSDFSDEARAKAYADCDRFIELLQDHPWKGYDSLYDAAEELQGDNCIGHDFWLTRNGHGAGFWDGDYDDCGDAICEALYAEFGRYAELNLYVNEEGKVDFE